MSDYSKLNAEVVLKKVEEKLAMHRSFDFRERVNPLDPNSPRICSELNIFDWWPKRLTQSHLKQMRTFLRSAIELGFTGCVSFKVGASGCANGMWAHKNESTDGYDPDGDRIYRSFTPAYTYWSTNINGKWYPDALDKPYDSIKTVKGLTQIIKSVTGGAQ